MNGELRIVGSIRRLNPVERLCVPGPSRSVTRLQRKKFQSRWTSLSFSTSSVLCPLSSTRYLIHPVHPATSLKMGKHSRKKQKISDDSLVNPLGVPADFGDQAEKDEEELLLENFLFGPADELISSVSPDQPPIIEDTIFDVGDHAETRPSRKSSAWTDSDDLNLQVSLAADKRRRKLRDALEEDTVVGWQYERRLRREFEKTNPSPVWARDTRRLPYVGDAGKRMRTSMGSDVEQEEEEEQVRAGLGLDYLLSGEGSVVDRHRVKSLSQGTIAIERLRDANLSAKAEGEVKVVQFHPSPQVPVLLAGSSDRRLRIFNVRDTSSLPYHILNP